MWAPEWSARCSEGLWPPIGTFSFPSGGESLYMGTFRLLFSVGSSITGPLLTVFPSPSAVTQSLWPLIPAECLFSMHKHCF